MLTRFSEPNEIFGPIDIGKLREGSVVTVTKGMLPEAEFVFLDELFNANSATALKGQGATDSNTTFQTSLTGSVIAVMPSGNLVVEAQRKIFMNNQHEDVTVRGVVRPGDIGANNTIASASLSNSSRIRRGAAATGSVRSPAAHFLRR